MKTFSKEIPWLKGSKLLSVDISKGRNGVRARKSAGMRCLQFQRLYFSQKGYRFIIETTTLFTLLKQEFGSRWISVQLT